MRIAVGLSGGVDSAVTALLLKKAGHEVVGVHLYCWPPKSEIENDGLTRAEWIKKNGCRADEDRQMALKTALDLSIPFQVLDFSEEYKTRVIDYFYSEYEKGRTPNPDVLCNSEIKFGLFLNWALDNGFDKVATGHYAKLEVDNRESLIQLVIPKDKHKDQTYFLWKLGQNELKNVLFPLGDLLKSEVRVIAGEANLGVATRKDSQGICFVGNVEVKQFLRRRLADKIGDVIDIDGRVIGKHKGVWFYTIGERGGWEIDPIYQHELMKQGKTPKFFVIEKRAEENLLVVAEEGKEKRNSFVVTDLNVHKNFGDKIQVRLRHGGELLACNVVRDGKRLQVNLVKDVRGVASGQSAVFYDFEGAVMGGGVIV